MRVRLFILFLIADETYLNDIHAVQLDKEQLSAISQLQGASKKAWQPEPQCDLRRPCR
jgi:hypothetical protein